jgi:hypothetical protein
MEAPVYVDITVTATVIVPETVAASEEEIKGKINCILERFFHPISGGPEGKGWEIGQDVLLPQVFDLIQAVEEVRLIQSLDIERKRGQANPDDSDVRIALQKFELVSSSREGFSVTVTKERL